MATEYALERTDCCAIGSFEDVKSLLHELIPSVKFAWTLSGPDKLKVAADRGIEFPELLQESLKTVPSLLEGRVELRDSMLEFGLGHSEPVMCLYVTPHGESEDLAQILTALEVKVGGKIVASGEERNRLT